MVKLVDSMSSLSQRKILLLGDFMLDNYTIGKVKRISPEAPVPVLQVEEQFDRPGGAGNVLLNFASLGLQVIPVGRIGADGAGARICESFRKEGVSAEGLFSQNNYATPVKSRLIADNQQLLRLDFEEALVMTQELEDEAFAFCSKAMQDVNLIAISDYGKGFLTPSFLTRVINLARGKGIPVIIDPKGRDFSKYRGATVIKPNLGEAMAASKLPGTATLKEIAYDLLEQTAAEALFITKSDKGISLYFKDEAEEHFPVAQVRQVRDVTGAGDTVLAVLACALANGLSLSDGAKLANIAAGIAVEQVGCVRVSLADIAKRLYEEDVMNKICDKNHLFLVDTVLKENPFALFILESSNALDKEFFKALHKVSQNSDLQVFVYFKNAAEDVETVHFLATLEEVNFLLVDPECVDILMSRYTPQEVINFTTSIV